MPLLKMGTNEVLGDKASHFFKSGNVVRSDKNSGVEALEPMLPRHGPEGTRVEYDIWYDTGDKVAIHGYCYTDAMTKLLYLRVASASFANRIMVEAIHHPITREGERIFQELGDKQSDKYRLRGGGPAGRFVIFLPGTNVYDKCVDEPKLKRAVDQGAQLKPHPLSAPGLIAHLGERFGEKNLLGKKTSAFEILEGADIVGCCENSEMGMAGLAADKTVYMFDKPHSQRTYTSIYRALQNGNALDPRRFKSILSAKYSGLISCDADDPQLRINTFFDHYADMKHVPPKNPDH